MERRRRGGEGKEERKWKGVKSWELAGKVMYEIAKKGKIASLTFHSKTKNWQQTNNALGYVDVKHSSV
jgi:hypothetical protein